MNLLKSVESTIANLVEGAFGRMFRSEVRPIELAHKLAREMDEHRTASVSRVYAPNEYMVWLSPQDRARYEGVEDDVIDELCAYLLEHARREQLILASQPHIAFHTDERLALGEFGIQARSVRLGRQSDHSQRPGRADAQAARAGASDRVPAAPGPGPGTQSGGLEPGGLERTANPQSVEEHGQTMIYSSSAGVRGAVDETHARRQPVRALLAVGGRRLLLPPGGGIVGRSRECDIVLDDVGVSRRHAEIRPRPDGWTVEDLGSTNGVLVNGRDARDAQLLHPGDRIELGSTEIIFEVG
jgi:Protein of unknown function (DUF3662)/FHA domain